MYSNKDKQNVLLTLKTRNKPTHRSVISSLYFVSHLIVFNTPIQDANCKPCKCKHVYKCFILVRLESC